MKRLLPLLLLLLMPLLVPGLAKSQVNPQTGHGAPSGPCLGPYTDIDTGNFYVCKVGQYSLAGSVSPNSPIPQSTVGPGFNVKTYGAKGDSRTCDVAASAGGGTTHMTGACNYTAADVGKSVFFNFGPVPTNALFASVPTITAFNSATDVTLSLPQNGGAVTGFVVIGTIDDTAVLTALAAAVAAAKGSISVGNRSSFSATPVLYFPAGGYFLCTSSANLSVPALTDGFVITGDGPDSTFLYTPANNAGGCTMTSPFLAVAGSAQHTEIKNMTFDGVNNNSLQIFNNAGASTHLYNTVFQRSAAFALATTPCVANQSALYAELLTIVNCGDGLKWSGNGEVRNWVSSNNYNRNVVIQNSVGVPQGSGTRFYGGLDDECTGDRCFDVINSHDVWLIGPALFSGATKATGACLHVDPTSFVHFSGGICGVFNQDSDENGVLIDLGGTLQSSDVRYQSSGTKKSIINNGTFNDNGGNTSESQFLIASGTSTGTTAVLTLTPSTANVNTNCTVGDALVVQGAVLPGYNGYFQAGATTGITAVTATTLTYTTIGSNLGALGAGGAAYCRNLQSFSGNLPKALLNNPIPNTCYVTITPIVNATIYQMCNWGSGSATNIIRITAASQNVTTCATAPIITISNGTVSQTLTLTSGKQFWDSFNAQDASTGVGTTIFKPSISLTGTDRITVRYDAGALSACATPPTQLSVSYTIAPILSN